MRCVKCKLNSKFRYLSRWNFNVISELRVQGTFYTRRILNVIITRIIMYYCKQSIKQSYLMYKRDSALYIINLCYRRATFFKWTNLTSIILKWSGLNRILFTFTLPLITTYNPAVQHLDKNQPFQFFCRTPFCILLFGGRIHFITIQFVANEFIFSLWMQETADEFADNPLICYLQFRDMPL